MPVQIILLVILAVGAVAVAVYSVIAQRYRDEVIGRTFGQQGTVTGSHLVIGLGEKDKHSLGEWLGEHLPASWGESEALKQKLVWAGFDTPTAPLTYTTLRVVFFVGLLIAVMPLLIGAGMGKALLLGAWALLAGWGLPVWFIGNRVFHRQETIRHSVPDALDLMVVCIEAGVSLDAALLRVARDIGHVHPEFANELYIVNRKTNAGVPREQALRGLYDRTGVEEVRALVSTMIQSEKWGTSIGHVLEVYAEALRVKRRQAIEKKAATAPLKMLFPLMLFILPALFITVMGPAVITIGKMFKTGFGG